MTRESKLSYDLKAIQCHKLKRSIFGNVGKLRKLLINTSLKLLFGMRDVIVMEGLGLFWEFVWIL